MSFDGTYAYRFTGFAVRYVDWHLVGVGTMTIKDDKITKGHHAASTLQLQGNEAGVQVGEYTLDGKWWVGDHEDEYEAEITFTSIDKQKDGVTPKQKLVGAFSFVTIGNGERLWMISKTTRNITVPDKERPALEVVSGEAIRIRNT